MRMSIAVLVILAACGSVKQSNATPPDAAPDAAADAPADGPMMPDAPPPPVVTAHWGFSTFANRGVAPSDPCPSGFTTAAVHARPWDPVLGQFVPGSVEVVARFTCASKQGAVELVSGAFLIWVSIEDAAGANSYARTASALVDTTGGDQTIALPTVFSDAGYIDLGWDLIVDQVRRDCVAALGTSGTISSTVVDTRSNMIFVDKFRCSDGFGAAGPFPVGSYDVTVIASRGPGQDTGASAPIVDVSVAIPNGLTHLGHVAIATQAP